MSRFVPGPNLGASLEAATRRQRLGVAGQVVEGAQRRVHTYTGHYEESVHTFDDGRGVGVQADDIAAHIIEYGKEGQPPQAPIAGAADEVGKFAPR